LNKCLIESLELHTVLAWKNFKVGVSSSPTVAGRHFSRTPTIPLTEQCGFLVALQDQLLAKWNSMPLFLAVVRYCKQFFEATSDS
jgi:hypothetical protein